MCVDMQRNLRYQKVRSQLNDLGYLQPLDTDSLLLVEHLLADYLHTTKKLRYFKETAQNSIRACHNLEISVEPYKSDNAKLVTQLNSLHSQILEQKTKHDEVIHDLQSQIRRLEAERSEVEDLVTLQTSRIQELELESQSKNERLLQLQGLDLKPVISTSVGSKKRSAPLASKRSFTHLEIDPGVKSVKDWQDHYAEINRLNEDPVVVDLVLLTEKRCQKLEKAIKNVEEEKRTLYSELELFAKKIADRDSEIDRLQRQLGGGRPAEAVNRDFYTEDSVLSSGDINSTMSECSNKSVSSKTLWLQQRLEEAIEKQHEAMCHAMRLADHNRMLEAQLKCFLDSKCHCSPTTYSDLNKSSHSNANQNESIQESFNNCITELNRKVDELMADNDALRKTSEKSAEEKKKLTNKINELTIVENKLTQEIARLSKVNAAQRAQIVDLEDRNYKCKCRKAVQGNLRKTSSGSFRTEDTESFKITNSCRSSSNPKSIPPVVLNQSEKALTPRISTSRAKSEFESSKQRQSSVTGCPLPRKSADKPDQSQNGSLPLTNQESRILCMYDDLGKNCQTINQNSSGVCFVRKEEVESVSSERKTEESSEERSVDILLRSNMQAVHASNEMASKCEVSKYNEEMKSACPVTPCKQFSSGSSELKHNPETKSKSTDRNVTSSSANYGCKSEAFSVYHGNRNTSVSHGSCLYKVETRSVQPQNLTPLGIANGNPTSGLRAAQQQNLTTSDITNGKAHPKENSNSSKINNGSEVIKCTRKLDTKPANSDSGTARSAGSHCPNSEAKPARSPKKNGEAIKCKYNFDSKSSSDQNKVPGFMNCARKIASKSNFMNNRSVSCIATTLQRCSQRKKAAECVRGTTQVVKKDSLNRKPLESKCKPANLAIAAVVRKTQIRPTVSQPPSNPSTADRSCSSNGGKLRMFYSKNP